MWGSKTALTMASRHSRRAAGSARREGPDGDGSLYPADPDRAVRAEGQTRV